MLLQPKIFLLILNYCEFIATIVALMHFRKVKHSYWKWFVLYLVYISFYELMSVFMFDYFHMAFPFYFAYGAIPIEFLFFIWLYAYKSLDNKKLFWICAVVYLLSFIPEQSLSKGKFYFSSFNYIVGSLILLALVCLEFNKQIKSDAILSFKSDKMFYINIGMVLFYIGNLPFFGLYYPIMKESMIWNNYYIYFMISNCIMYLLFTASFLWGKTKSY
jgi:hypothetical protein